MKYVVHALFSCENQHAEITNIVKIYIANSFCKEALIEYELALQFLQSYASSADTFKSYRREIERLLQWCWFEQGILLCDLNRFSFELYLKFAFAPPKKFIATKSATRFILAGNKYVANKDWRPYLHRTSKVLNKIGTQRQKSAYQMTPSAKKALFAGASTFFTYLVQESYLKSNPVALIRQKSRYIAKEQHTRVSRKLSDVQWQCVLEAVTEKTKENASFERHLFLISTFYLMGVRISELSATIMHHPVMGDFAADSGDLWWFRVIGKGNKIREIAVPDTMLVALKRYRLWQGLPPLPFRGENTPIIMSYRGNKGLGVRQIRLIIQECFDLAVEKLKQQQQDDAAYDLMAATVHWLRHTAISADVKSRPRHHVRDDAGHDNITTTDRYIDIDREARHKSAKNKRLLPQ